jgi:hypothetical protein
MAQSYADGLCYNCDEKFVVGHRRKKLSLLEIADTTDEEEDVEEEIECAALTGHADMPGISLHAITGLRARGFHTMKVYVSIDDVVVVALLNYGSSHSFVDIDVARRASVHLQPSAGLSVSLANNDRIASPGKAPAQTVLVGGEPFNIDLYALPLGDYNMVFGVQWLGTLGLILWDFAQHTLAFSCGGTRILWCGVDVTPSPASAAMTAVDGDLLDTLLEEFAALF